MLPLKMLFHLYFSLHKMAEKYLTQKGLRRPQFWDRKTRGEDYNVTAQRTRTTSAFPPPKSENCGTELQRNLKTVSIILTVST